MVYIILFMGFRDSPLPLNGRNRMFNLGNVLDEKCSSLKLSLASQYTFDEPAGDDIVDITVLT